MYSQIVCIRINICIHTCIHIHLHIFIYISMYIFTFESVVRMKEGELHQLYALKSKKNVCTYVSIFISLCNCMHVYMCTYVIHSHAHTHTQTHTRT